MAARAIAGYELLEELGRGGMGVVYRARDPRAGRPVALKLLPRELSGSEGKERFLREGRGLARVQHPGVVRVHDLGEEQGQLYLVMDLVQGTSLQARLEQRGPLPPREAARLVQRLAEAVEAAHAVQVVHRDLKPENVLIDAAGRPRLLDFGLAKPLDLSRDLTRTAQFLGTPGYWAPEQAGGSPLQVGPATDVYGLGGVLYACLCGEPPLRASSFAEAVIQARDLEPEPPSRRNPDVPRALDEVTLRCLAKSPAARYPSAAALGEELERFLGGQRTETAARAGSRRGLLAAGGIALAGALAAGLILLQGRSSSSAQPAHEQVVEPRIEVTRPRDNELLFKGAVAIEGRLLEAGGPCEVRVGGIKRRVNLQSPDFRFSVELQPGENHVTVEVVEQQGLPCQAVELTLRHYEAPKWYQALPEDQRPSLPLPKGLGFTGGRGEYVNEKDGSVLVYVPPGTFLMGTDDDGSEGDRNANPQHEVTLTRGFFMGKYELSWQQFLAYCTDTGDRPPSDESLGKEPDLPAFNVQWKQAVAYCRWAGLRLPSEAEWEYAGRGTDGRLYPWGNDEDDDRVRTGRDTSSGETGPVAVRSFPDGASPFGCLNMAGNVSEWVADTWSRYPGGPRTDPLAQEPGATTHVMKNAGFSAPLAYCRLYARHAVSAIGVRTDMGFRVARSQD